MPAKSPEDIHVLFVEAFNRADVEGLVALYEPNAVLVTAAGNAVGQTAIRDAYKRIVAGGGRMELQTRTVLDSGEGLALLHGAWSLHREGKVVQGLSTEIVRRQEDGLWLFALDEPRTPAHVAT